MSDQGGDRRDGCADPGAPPFACPIRRPAEEEIEHDALARREPPENDGLDRPRMRRGETANPVRVFEKGARVGERRCAGCVGALAIGQSLVFRAIRGVPRGRQRAKPIPRGECAALPRERGN